MMQYPRTHFVASAAMPLDRTVFHADGSRTVTGTLGTVRYDADGNATFLGPASAFRAGDAVRWDLAA